MVQLEKRSLAVTSCETVRMLKVINPVLVGIGNCGRLVCGELVRAVVVQKSIAFPFHICVTERTTRSVGSLAMRGRSTPEGKGKEEKSTSNLCVDATG